MWRGKIELSHLSRLHNKEYLNRLCAVGFLNAEIGIQAQQDIFIAFDWAWEEFRLYDALRRVSILKDEKELFRALLLLMYITLLRLKKDETLAKQFLQDVVDLIIDFSEKARREGLLALEDDIPELKDEFIQKGIQLVVDGTDPELVRGIMETELYTITNTFTEYLLYFNFIFKNISNPQLNQISEHYLNSLMLSLYEIENLKTLADKLVSLFKQFQENENSEIFQNYPKRFIHILQLLKTDFQDSIKEEVLENHKNTLKIKSKAYYSIIWNDFNHRYTLINTDMGKYCYYKVYL